MGSLLSKPQTERRTKKETTNKQRSATQTMNVVLCTHV